MSYTNTLAYTTGINSSATEIIANDTTVQFTNTAYQLKKYVRVLAAIHPNSTMELKIDLRIVAGTTVLDVQVGKNGVLVGSSQAITGGPGTSATKTFALSGWQQNDTIEIWAHLESAGTGAVENMKVNGTVSILGDVYNA